MIKTMPQKNLRCTRFFSIKKILWDASKASSLPWKILNHGLKTVWINIQKTQQNKIENLFQGIGLRCHRDDGSIFDNDDSNQENFRELLKLMAEIDNNLNTHLKTCARNAKYFKNHAEWVVKLYKRLHSEPNSSWLLVRLLVHIMEYQSTCELETSWFCKRYLVLYQYVKDSVAVEKLIEYVKCHNIKGNTIARLITDTTTKLWFKHFIV